MDNHHDQAVLARRVRLAVAELDTLCVLPSVAVTLAQSMAQTSLDVEELVPLIEVCPELAALVLSLADREGLVAYDCDYRLAVMAQRLPRACLVQALLALKPCPPFDSAQAGPGALWVERSGLVVHSVAVAQAARRIAETMEMTLAPDLAYLGGLLHDVGKLALQEVMPKGYARMVGAARAQGSPLYQQERTQLGIDHSGIGAALAQRWHLPVSVQRAIRLHHLPGQEVAMRSSDFVLTRVVQVANALAKSCSWGDSGCFAPSPEQAALLRALGLSEDQMEALAVEIPTLLEPVRQVLQLDMEDPHHRYGACLHDLVMTLSATRDRRDTERQEQERTEAFHAFVMELIRSVDAGLNPLEVAQCCARHWQRFFQTGKVCLLLYPQPEQAGRSVVLIDALAQGTMMVLDPDLDDLVETPPAGTRTDLSSGDDWEPLFAEIEAQFHLERTRALVLRAHGHAVGALAFELNQPSDVAHFQEDYQQAARVVAHLLDLALARATAEDLVEELLDTAGPSPAPAPEPDTHDVFDALAEMAAGFAHELNNPLSIISGRAQLLAQEETDAQTQQTLRLIQDNVRNMAKLVESLLEFAEPPTPHRSACDLTTLIEEAVALAQHKGGDWRYDVQVHCPASCPQVDVDSAQIASALANILTNAGQSYEASEGRIEIAVTALPTGDVSLRVRDWGRGMDEETRKRALHPFFSALPAGRKRGMGLAYAHRLATINGGHLSIQSQLDTGTTATLRLPRAEV